MTCFRYWCLILMNLERFVAPSAFIMTKAGILTFSNVISASFIWKERASVFMYTARCVTSTIARYSASAIKSAVVYCLHDDQPEGMS